MKIKIRKVQIEDAQDILKILNPIIRAGKFSSMTEENSLEEQVSFIKNLAPKAVYNLAYDAESYEIVGIQDILPQNEIFNEVGEISTFVNLELRNKNIGNNLMTQSLKDAKLIGYKKILAIIRNDNSQAIRFYQKNNFRKIGICLIPNKFERSIYELTLNKKS